MFKAVITYKAHFPSEGQSISSSNLTVQNFHQIPERRDLIRLDLKYKSRIVELEVERIKYFIQPAEEQSTQWECSDTIEIQCKVLDTYKY